MRNRHMRHGTRFFPPAALLLAMGVPVAAHGALYVAGTDKGGHPMMDASEPDAMEVQGDRHLWRSERRTVLREIGRERSEGAMRRVDGFGKDMPLEDALPMVLPDTWRVEYNQGVDRRREVTWEAIHEPWIDGLYIVLNNAGYAATVAWESRTVVVDKTVEDPDARQHVAQDDTPEDHGHAKSEAEPKTEAEPEPVVPRLMPGEKLSDALNEYVRSQGWNGVRWRLDHDYRIQDSIPMEGDMIEAITRLMRAYQSQGGLLGAEPVFMRGNRMVVIQPMDMSASRRFENKNGGNE